MRRMTFVLLVAASFAWAGASALVYAQAKPPETVILKGAPMGAVKLDHAKHAKEYGAKCTDCHHASMPAMPAKAANQKCSDCHTKKAAEPKMEYKAAFHDAMAKKGTCIDCHAKAVAAKKAAPMKCNECHKKENG